MENNLFANIKSKERSTNFTKAEMDRLQLLVTKYQNILFCKKTDATSSKQKESAWNLIEGEFNALGDIPRTKKQLKYKFENLKKVAKKEASKERQEMRRTGGGPLPLPSSSTDDTTDWLRSIMPSSIDGNKAIFDDDTLNQTTVFPLKLQDQEQSNNTEIIGDCFINESQLSKEVPATEVSLEKKASEFDASTPYSSLKRPISSPLRRRVKRKTKEDEISVKQLLREKKISLIDNLQELELKKINDSIRHAEEIHQQRLRHNDERHKMEIEKLKLDIEKSKIELKEKM